MKVINDSEHINMKKTDLGGDDLTRDVEFCEGFHEKIFIQDFMFLFTKMLFLAFNIFS